MRSFEFGTQVLICVSEKCLHVLAGPAHSISEIEFFIMKNLLFACIIVLTPCFVGCSGGSSVQPGLSSASPSPAPSATPSIVAFSIDVPANGNILLTIPPTTGYSGSILFPVYQGTPGTVRATFSGLVPAASNPLGGGPYSPTDVVYACFTFQPIQLPSGAPVVDLTAVPAATGLKTVGFAYRERGGGVWNERFGTAPYAAAVHIVTVDGVGLYNTGTCFALFVSP